MLFGALTPVFFQNARFLPENCVFKGLIGTVELNAYPVHIHFFSKMHVFCLKIVSLRETITS